MKAPTVNGEHLAVPDFAAVPNLVDANRHRLDSSPVLIHGIPLQELRRRARSELGLPDGPIIATGHQPEFFHPGVWVKNFAACGLARKTGGMALNLIVDTDTVKSTVTRLPTWPMDDPTEVTLSTLAYDDSTGEMPHELRDVANHERLASFGSRLATATASWPCDPVGVTLLGRSCREAPHDAVVKVSCLEDSARPARITRIAEWITCLRRTLERAWGCDIVDLPVSRLAGLESFQRFARHIADNGEQFRDCYNTALAEYRAAHRVRSRNHPAPDLTAGELPFWTMTAVGRARTFEITHPEQTRPRALTLTLFARLVLGDYFIHGLGGGIYDRVTDDIIRGFFDIEPPAYQILTATLHLPLEQPHYDPDALHQAQRVTRDLRWNPYKYLERAEHAEHREIIAMPQTTRRERRARYRAFRDLSTRLQPQIEHLRESNCDRRAVLEQRLAANSVLTRRDYAWILYPESVLKPFLQRFLEL